MVRCRNCGFLSVREERHRTLCEAEQSYRDSASVSVGYIRPVTYETEPVCFVLAADLRAEGSTRDEVLRIISQERDCDRFVEWHQGFSPKEHQEMLDHKAQLEYQRERDEAQRKWERERLELDRQRDDEERRWRDSQAERDRQWRAEDRGDLEHALRRERYKGWAVAVWTLVSALVTWTLAMLFAG